MTEMIMKYNAVEAMMFDAIFLKQSFDKLVRLWCRPRKMQNARSDSGWQTLRHSWFKLSVVIDIPVTS
jgi:hypothetical protein